MEAQLVRDPSLPIIGERRTTCSNCDSAIGAVGVFETEGCCPVCGVPVCMFCGCTEERGCVHPSFPDGSYICEWQFLGVCSFCFYQQAEAEYGKAVRIAETLPPEAFYA